MGPFREEQAGDRREQDLLFRARQRREHFGFDASNQAIEAARRDPERAVDEFEVDFTPAESAAIANKRLTYEHPPEVGSALAGASMAEVYAGLEFSWAAPDGQWLVGFTKDHDAFLASLRLRHPFPERLTAFSADFSLAFLSRVQREIREDGTWQREHNLVYDRSTIAVRRNRVVVSFESVPEGAPLMFRDRYGDAVEIQQAEGTGDAV